MIIPKSRQIIPYSQKSFPLQISANSDLAKRPAHSLPKIQVCSSTITSAERPDYINKHANNIYRTHTRLSLGKQAETWTLQNNGSLEEYLTHLKAALKDKNLDLSWTISEFSFVKEASIKSKLEKEVRNHAAQAAELDPKTGMSLHILYAQDKEAAFIMCNGFDYLRNVPSYRIWTASDREAFKGYTGNLHSTVSTHLTGDLTNW